MKKLILSFVLIAIIGFTSIAANEKAVLSNSKIKKNCSFRIAKENIVAINYSSKSGKFTNPHCDFTAYVKNPDGTTTIVSGHIDGAWCYQLFGDSVVYL